MSIGFENIAVGVLQKQANGIAKALVADIYNKLPKNIQKNYNVDAEVAKLEKKEIIAIIAYLQRLGTDIKAEPKTDSK